MKVRTKLVFFIYLFYISKSINRPIYLYKNLYPLYNNQSLNADQWCCLYKKISLIKYFFLLEPMPLISCTTQKTF